MKVTVDRLEENMLVVILPDGTSINMSNKLCIEAKEGDIINIEVSKDETEENTAKIANKFELLKNRIFDK